MAVNKMEKVTIIAAADQQEAVLQSVQGLQAVEVKDFSHDSVDQAYLETYFSSDETNAQSPGEKYYEDLLQRVQEALLFIEHYSAREGQKSGLKRRVETLSSLEASFDQSQLLPLLEHVEDLKDRLEQLNSRRKSG